MSGVLKIVADLQQATAPQPKTQFWLVKVKENKPPHEWPIVPSETGWIEYLKSRHGVSYEAKTNKLVREKDGIVSEMEMADLKRLVMADIEAFPDTLENGETKEMILSMVMKFEAKLFKENGMIDFVGSKEFDWLRSTKDKAWFFYKNGAACVTKDGIELVPYGDLEGKFIWEGQILDRDFKLEEPEGSDWTDFCWKAAGQTDALVCNFNNALGYALHSYKDPSRPYLTIFGEAVEDSGKGGGAGKNLTSTAISHLVPTAVKDMRQYSASDAFKWSMVKYDTKVFVLSDLKSNFDHSILYNLITDGFEVNAKNQPVRVYEFEDSPKLLASTNYSLDISAGHSNRRMRLVEFSGHWNAENTPADHYGRLFFSEWEEKDWNQFDTYMLLAAAQYLRSGFPKVEESEGSKRKRIMNHAGAQDMLDWLNQYDGEGFRVFSEVYIDYSNCRYVTSKPVGKNVFLTRLEELLAITDKQMDVAEQAKVKSIKIW